MAMRTVEQVPRAVGEAEQAGSPAPAAGQRGKAASPALVGPDRKPSIAQGTAWIRSR